jgi:hypothetical protein
MEDRRIDELIAERQSQLDQSKEISAENAEQERRDEEFSTAWHGVYPHRSSDANGPGSTELAARLVHLSGLLRERFWDFQIARRLRAKSFGLIRGLPRECEICLRLLGHACAGHDSVLGERLSHLGRLFPEIRIAHHELFGQFKLEDREGLPYTPPLSRPEMALILEISRDKFRGQVRAGRWLLPALVNTTAKNFTLREVSADKGYGSLNNYDVIEAHGATPFIAFKSIHTGKGGGLWAKMFRYFNMRRDDFLKHYHKRSNVESTFAMIKAKFGDHIRSKTDVAMVNEALCKLLCHNIVVLIHEVLELGIEPTFWAGSAPAQELA